MDIQTYIKIDSSSFSVYYKPKKEEEFLNKIENKLKIPLKTLNINIFNLHSKMLASC